MKRNILTLAVVLTAGTLLAAGVDDVKSAIKNLSGKSYSWTTTTEMGGGQGGGQFRPGPTEGTVDKDGFAYIKMTRGNQVTEAVVKSGKAVIKTQDGWQDAAAQQGGQGGPGGRGRGMLGRMLQNYRLPAQQAEDLVNNVKDLKKDGEVYSGDLTEDGVKQLLTFGGRGGQNAPQVSNPKGTVKFWVKDGTLVKYEFNVQGTMTFNNNERTINRTTTVEIKDIGAVKTTIPDEAKKKLS